MDFGFKLLFGTEVNKDLLISLLNGLFYNDGLGEAKIEGITSKGEKFIVEK